MVQNKIYQNFLGEIFKLFLITLLSLSLIALTIRAVSFLELIVESGYPLKTYFKYSLLNLFGIIPKFIPLSFFLALLIFSIRHLRENDFVILWTSGIKKIQITNLLLFSSVIIVLINLIFSTTITPSALNKSRQLLSSNYYNSFLPTIRAQQFNDTFNNFTFFVENKIDNEIQNIFLYDKGNNLKNLSSNSSSTKSTTILAQTGIVGKRNLILFNGEIISEKKDFSNEIIKFQQLNINLSNFNTATIKEAKIQETSTFKLFKCFSEKNKSHKYCNENFKKEIFPTLNRRLVMPFYIPVLTLIASILLINSKKFYFNKSGVFIYGIIVLLFSELVVRLTGVNNLILWSFLIFPLVVLPSVYIFLIRKFSRESKKNE